MISVEMSGQKFTFCSERERERERERVSINIERAVFPKLGSHDELKITSD